MKRTIVIDPQYEQLTEFIHRLPDTFLTEGEYIHDGRNKIKVFEVNGLRLNVKRYRIPILLNRFVYACLRQPKAVRAYENALVLLKKDIATPAPVAYLIERQGLLIGYSYFISIQVDHPRRFYEFGRRVLTPEQTVVLENFGAFMARMHAAGVYHRDLSPGNILFRMRGSDQVDFCIVDINRMSFGNISRQKACKNFARLWGPVSMLQTIAASYARYNHEDARPIAQGMIKYWRKYWRKAYQKGRVEFDIDPHELEEGDE